MEEEVQTNKTMLKELLDLNPPVGVFFETEGINTLRKDSEMGMFSDIQ